MEKEIKVLSICGLQHSDWIAKPLRSASPPSHLSIANGTRGFLQDGRSGQHRVPVPMHPDSGRFRARLVRTTSARFRSPRSSVRDASPSPSPRKVPRTRFCRYWQFVRPCRSPRPGWRDSRQTMAIRPLSPKPAIFQVRNWLTANRFANAGRERASDGSAFRRWCLCRLPSSSTSR